jgi:arginyl-tRNA synthetase
MKEKLSVLLTATIDDCFKNGALKKSPVPDYVIEIPNNSKHGHFATNLCLALASSQKRSPREIAAVITENLKDEKGLIEKTEVAGPGFINFWIKPKQWGRILSKILSHKSDYGRNITGNGEKTLVEFVSANPTGPLHVGHARGAALGDTLCRVLSFCGYNVTREFYINDAGQQIRMLGESIASRLKQISDPEFPFPDKGYHGNYIYDLADTIAESTDLTALSSNKTVEACSRKGKDLMFERIRQDLAEFRVDFDVWYSETDLYNSGELKSALDQLKDNGQIYEKDGAIWINTSDLGDDKDRVIRKSDGQFTYFASDIAYHLNKRRRGFSKAINIWGADHHGYVPRLRAALSACGSPEDWLSVILIQLVKLWQSGQEVKMSKRSGDFVTIKELINEVGVDAMRFVFLTKNHESPLDFDIDLVKRQDSENPVYYVQYAHARICSIFKKAADEGISLPDKPENLVEHLVLSEEMELIRLMAEFPPLLADIARTLEPHRLTYYLTALAALFHHYFNMGNKNPDHRIITDNQVVSQARLSLVNAIRTTIANGLKLLGITTPEKM